LLINAPKYFDLLYKLMHKLHMLENLWDPWRWPKIKAETCPTVN